jgi:hypothetical protein
MLPIQRASLDCSCSGHNSGYESRIAHFKGVDHEWAEVNNGTNWLIVDPGYIGN